jgi:hypothetical protein
MQDGKVVDKPRAYARSGGWMIGNFPPPSIPMASPSGNLGIDEGPEPPARDEPLQ